MLKDGGLSERKCFQANKDAKAIVFGCAAGTMSSKKRDLENEDVCTVLFFSAQKWQGFERKSSKIPKSQNIWATVAGASWQCKHAGVTLGYVFLQVSPLTSANDVLI